MRSASSSIHDMDVSSTHSRTVIKVDSTDVQQHAAVRMLQVAHESVILVGIMLGRMYLSQVKIELVVKLK